MQSIFITFLYLCIFILSYLGFFSFSSFFHTLLGHDLNVLEEWLYHNRLSIIASAKFMALLMVFIFPRIYSIGFKKMFANLKIFFIDFLKQWKMENKDWFLHLIFCFVLYFQFFQIEFSQSFQFSTIQPFQVTYCLLFWMCDLIFIFVYLNQELTKFSIKYPLIDVLIVSLLPLITTSIVSYSPLRDLLQLYAVIVCILYLMKTEKLYITGAFTLTLLGCFFAVTMPLNFLTNLDDTWWSLKSDGFSMPWALIFVFYVVIYKLLKNNLNVLYKFIFFRTKN